MQNNQSFSQQYFWFNSNNQYQEEEFESTEELFEELKDNDDYFHQSYAEFEDSTQNIGIPSLDNSNLSTSEPYSYPSFDENIYDNQDSFLSTSLNYVDYSEDDYSQVEDSEIHYLNFIRKSQIAVSRKNALENQNYSYQNYHYQEEQEENFKTYTIVCIDDSRAVVNAIKMYLDDKIFSVIGINDPLKALMQVTRLKPDLILLDITMPSLNGYELCSLLRKHSSLKETPVIMLTGKKGIMNRVKAKMVKASDYITKPFQKKDLLKVIFKYIDF